jgi:hypothetical protein
MFSGLNFSEPTIDLGPQYGAERSYSRDIVSTQRDINLVVRILSQVLRTELRLGRLSASRATGWVVLNQLRLGVVIVDADASISLANRAGIAALRAHAVGVRNGRLTFERLADQAKLLEALAKMAEAGSPPVQSLCLGPHTEGLLLHLTLLTGPTR